MSSNTFPLPEFQLNVLHTPSETFEYRGRTIDVVLTVLKEADNREHLIEIAIDGFSTDPQRWLFKNECALYKAALGVFNSEIGAQVVRSLLQKAIDSYIDHCGEEHDVPI